jgi:hypothetical protein
MNSRGFLNGSFSDITSWCIDEKGLAAVAAAMGHPTNGPLVLLVNTPPGYEGVPGCSIGTETVRMIVDGSCSIGDTTYGMGDVIVQAANAPWQPIIAGRNGVKEVVLFGERQVVFAGIDKEEAWPLAIRGLFIEIAQKLQNIGKG